jgi:hypothetical protein
MSGEEAMLTHPCGSTLEAMDLQAMLERLLAVHGERLRGMILQSFASHPNIATVEKLMDFNEPDAAVYTKLFWDSTIGFPSYVPEGSDADQMLWLSWSAPDIETWSIPVRDLDQGELFTDEGLCRKSE